MKEHSLSLVHTESHTFFHHSGNSSSQIDYVMTTDKHFLRNYCVSGKDYENTSSHVSVSASLSMSVGTSVSMNNKPNKPVKKLLWHKTDTQSYISVLNRELKKNGQKEKGSVDQKLQTLTEALHAAAVAAVPSRISKLEGPNWRASPKVKELLSNCRHKYRLWIARGKSDNILCRDNIMAKREQRKQLRHEKFNDRKNFYSELMSNPSTDKFYQLIRKNNGNRGHSPYLH